MFRLLRIKISLGVLAIVFYLPTLLVSFTLLKKNRAPWFRLASIWLIRMSLFVGGVHIRAHDLRDDFKKRNFIYASNHPSYLDGFVLQAILGPSAVPFVAPFAQFPGLIAKWMRHMGAIDVLRDDIDKARYKNSNTKKEALEKALAVLKRGESLLIFPEGHTEMIEALYYFHTGPARLSLASGVPIQPVVVKDAHSVFTNTIHKGRNTVTLSFKKRLLPDDEYGADILFTSNEALRQKVRDTTARLEAEILNELPLRSVTEQRAHAQDVGVFVDIDMTIYDGLSQIDFVLDLIKKKQISVGEGFSIFGFFILEKLGFVSHERMMQKAMSVLSGWKAETVQKLINRFFLRIALPKVQYGLYSILEDHLAKEHRVVFVSEAIHPLAKSFADFFEADGAIDTSLKRRGKTYTGEIRLLCRGNTKAQGVTEFVAEHDIDLKKSYAYADSFSDVPFLQLVGHPVAVQPDRKLRRFASSHSMRVLEHAA